MEYQQVTIQGGDIKPWDGKAVGWSLPDVLTALAQAVNIQIQAGWKPLGGVAHSPTTVGQYHTWVASQAITKGT